MRPPISLGTDQFMRKGTWSPDEDALLVAYIRRYGIWNWTEMSKVAGLKRTGKSCRLRWLNYLKPDIRRGDYTKEEDATILRLHKMLGNKWSTIAAKLPGRTDNDIKNYWHTYLKRRIKKHEGSPTNEPKQGMETNKRNPGTKQYDNSPQQEQVPALPSAIPVASDPGHSSVTDGSASSSSVSSIQEPLPCLWDDPFSGYSMEELFLMEDNSWLSYTDCTSWFEESATYSYTSNEELASDSWGGLFMH